MIHITSRHARTCSLQLEMGEKEKMRAHKMRDVRPRRSELHFIFLEYEKRKPINIKFGSSGGFPLLTYICTRVLEERIQQRRVLGLRELKVADFTNLHSTTPFYVEQWHT